MKQGRAETGGEKTAARIFGYYIFYIYVIDLCGQGYFLYTS